MDRWVDVGVDGGREGWIDRYIDVGMGGSIARYTDDRWIDDR